MDAASPALAESAGLVESEATAFDWRNCWYPVSFVQDLPHDKPYAFSLYDELLVMFLDKDGRPVCLDDRCAHRAARLSDGRVVDGKIECLYHGWQYDGSGRCTHIPQLPPQNGIPARACARMYHVEVHQGIVWLWAGKPEDADPKTIPLTREVDVAGVSCVDFQMDLPYDQTYLIENVIDVAHIHIAHDGVRGGGMREMAKPLDFEITESTVKGIRGGYRTLRADMPEGSGELSRAIVEFVAPNLIRYTSAYKNADLIAGLSLYSIPFGKSRCRLLYRKYSNFSSWKERIKPRWFEHWTQCLILEQDMAVVVGQYEHVERTEQDLRKFWFPLSTSDRLVLEYRRWLDRFGGQLPFFRGLSLAKAFADEPRIAPPRGRFAQHTLVCATCSKAHRDAGRGASALWVAAALLGAAGIATAGSGWAPVAALLALACLGGVAGLRWFQRRFE